MSLIYSQQELEKFINILPQLEKDELWFVSLSCRNKYLNEQEREFYHLSRTEMFAREFIFETKMENFLYVLDMLDKQLLYRRTKSNQLFPEKAMIVYFNLNPSSGLQAYFEFQKEMNKEVAELMNGLEQKHNVDNMYGRFKKCMSVLKSKYQTAQSRRLFLDVDFDTKDFSYVQEYLDFCISNKIKFFIVDTKNGFHVCIDKSSIKCNMYELITQLDKKIKQETEGTKEIILNKNLMIPLPGSIQAGHEVKIIDMHL